MEGPLLRAFCLLISEIVRGAALLRECAVPPPHHRLTSRLAARRPSAHLSSWTRIWLPDRHFKTWTIDEVRAATEGEEIYYMPGTKRRVTGNRRKLLETMEALGVTIAGDLPYPEYDRLSFSLVTWQPRTPPPAPPRDAVAATTHRTTGRDR